MAAPIVLSVAPCGKEGTKTLLTRVASMLISGLVWQQAADFWSAVCIPNWCRLSVSLVSLLLCLDL